MSVLAAISRRAMPALLAAALLAGAAARAQDGAAVAEATRLVGQMTLDEKLAFLDGDAPPAGTGTGVNACVGHLPGLPRLGIPPLCFGDGPAGVSNGATKVTQFPAPEAAAASWDVALMREFGRAMAEEQSGKGRNVVLGPTLNILRTPRWGRAGESFGEDPYLTAQLGVAEILGLQERGVIAEAKHFAANNQETDRLGDGPDFHAVDARVGERALQEIYLPAFKAAVQDGQVRSAMCAYNKINGVHACENAPLLAELRGWGFTGFVASDWYFAHRSTLASAEAGLDVSMPGGQSPFGFPDFYGAPLKAAVQDGRLPQSVVDGMAIRVVTAVVEAGLLGRPAAGAPDRDVRSAAHTDLARRIELEGAVLLKNDGVLPLAATAKTIAVIGEDAAGHVQTTEAYGGFVTREGIPVSTPLDALKARLTGASILYAPTPTGVDPLPAFEPPGGFRVDYFADADLAGTPAQTAQAATVDLAAPPPGLAGQPWSARWTARFTPPASGRHTFSLSGGGWAQLYVDRRLTAEVFKEQFRLVSQGVVELEAGRPVELRIDYRPASTIIGPKLQLGWSGPAEAEATTAAAAAAAKSADVALVFAGDAVSEGGDRTSLALPGDQDRLIAAVAAANPRTVVVLNTVGPVLMPWLGQVAGVVEAWYGGEQDGAAMAALLTGDEDFSGRLTATFPADESQGPGVTAAAFPGRDLAVTYDEGIDVGYRFYDSHGQAPLFPFGYGLSYTTFQLRRPSLRREAGGVIVGAEVANIGRRAGAEVAQLYLGFPPAAGEPPWQLKGFQRVKVAPGQAQAASFRLGPEAFQVYDPRLKAWCTPAGAFEIRIARDSRDPGVRLRLPAAEVPAGPRCAGSMPPAP